MTLSNYEIIVMADYPSNDASLDSELNTYRSSGHHVVLLGKSMKFGIKNIGVGSGNGASQNKDELKIQSSHYITSGYTIGNLYTITSSNNAIYYHSSFSGSNIISIEANDGRIVVGTTSNLIIYGPTRPDLFVSDGDTFAIRVLDYALMNS